MIKSRLSRDVIDTKMISKQSSTSTMTRIGIMKQKTLVFIKHVILIIWCFTTLYPILWAISNSFRDNLQIFGSPFALPNPLITTNFPRAFRAVDLIYTFPNSMFYAVVTCIITIFLSAMVAFYLSKLSKGKLLYTYFVIGLMIPIQAILIPIFISLRDLQLLNTRIGIILVYVVTSFAFSIFILTGFMKKGVPDDIIEAAIIDGCGLMGVFLRIVLPISKVGLATAGTFVFLNIWNEFLFALLMLPSPQLRTLNLAVYMLRGPFTSDHGLLSAGAVVLIIPAVVMYMLFQEQVVKGLTAGAIKG